MIYALLSRFFLSRFTHFFRRFFETENQSPQTFILLECMLRSKMYFTRIWGGDRDPYRIMNLITDNLRSSSILWRFLRKFIGSHSLQIGGDHYKLLTTYTLVTELIWSVGTLTMLSTRSAVTLTKGNGILKQERLRWVEKTKLEQQMQKLIPLANTWWARCLATSTQQTWNGWKK